MKRSLGRCIVEAVGGVFHDLPLVSSVLDVGPQGRVVLQDDVGISGGESRIRGNLEVQRPIALLMGGLRNRVGGLREEEGIEFVHTGVVHMDLPDFRQGLGVCYGIVGGHELRDVLRRGIGCKIVADEHGRTEQVDHAQRGTKIFTQGSGEAVRGQYAAHQEIQVGDEQIIGAVEIAAGEADGHKPRRVEGQEQEAVAVRPSPEGGQALAAGSREADQDEGDGDGIQGIEPVQRVQGTAVMGQRIFQDIDDIVPEIRK